MFVHFCFYSRNAFLRKTHKKDTTYIHWINKDMVHNFWNPHKRTKIPFLKRILSWVYLNHSVKTADVTNDFLFPIQCAGICLSLCLCALRPTYKHGFKHPISCLMHCYKAGTYAIVGCLKITCDWHFFLIGVGNLIGTITTILNKNHIKIWLWRISTASRFLRTPPHHILSHLFSSCMRTYFMNSSCRTMEVINTVLFITFS